MAILILQHVLLGASRIVNQHLLLHESFKIIANPHVLPLPDNSTSQVDIELPPILESSRLIFINSIVFVTSVISFFSAIWTLHSLDSEVNHRIGFIRLLKKSLIFHISYLYIVNLLATTTSLSDSVHLRSYIHLLVVIILFVGLWMNQPAVYSVGDSLSIYNCIRQQKEIQAIRLLSYFVTYLMWGALSLAGASAILAEMSIICDFSNTFFTNSTLTLSALAIAIEILILHLFTASNADQESLSGCLNVYFSLVHKKAVLNLKQSLKTHNIQKSLALPVSVLSISSSYMMHENLGEVVHTTDEDEYDNSTNDWFHATRLKSLSTRNLSDVNHYDRDKFSLYDNFEIHGKFTKKTSKELKLVKEFTLFNKILDIVAILLLNDDLYFGQQLAMLIVVGTIFQINQLCYLSEYLNYIVHDSPLCLRNELVSISNFLYKNSVNHQKLGNVIWASLICSSVLAQNLVKVISLHFLTLLDIKNWSRKILVLATLLSITYPPQMVFNLYLIHSDSRMNVKIKLIVIITQLLFVQFQIGFIEACAEIAINDLSLKYTQRVADIEPIWLKKGKSVQCTVHGILSGSFYLAGSAIVSSINLIATSIFTSYSSKNLSFGTLFITSMPAITLATLATTFGSSIYKRK